MGRRISGLVIAIGVALAPHALNAQLPHASTRAVGLANAYTAAARGYEAIQWNPAYLGMPGRPSLSFNLAQASLDFGSNTFSLGDFRKYANTKLTDEDKNEILGMVREGGVDRPLTMELGAGVSSLAVTAGGFGFSFNVQAQGISSLSSDAVELGLFGNATRVQPGEFYDGSGTSFGGWGAATVAFSYGRQFPVPVGVFAAGATVKLIQGLFVGYGEALDTQLRNAPTFLATAGGHALVSDVDGSVSGGSGFGIDLGGAYELPSGLRLGLVLENFLNTMSWSDDNLLYYNQQFLLGEVGDQIVDSTVVDVDGVGFDPTDPLQADLRDSLSQIGSFAKLVRAGLAYRQPKFTLTADAMVRVTPGIGFGDAQRVSGGVEFRPASVVALRMGLATSFENTLGVHGGLGFNLGPVRLDWAISNTSNGDRKGFIVAAGLSVIN